MLWLKALHIIFVVAWFAGLFYLPRLFIYHIETTEPAVRAQLKIMERKLMIMTHIGGILAITFGLALLSWFMLHAPGYFMQGWLHAKLVLVALLIGYHFWLVWLKKRFARDACNWSSVQLRLFNEIPSVLLAGIVLLVVIQHL